MLLVPTLSDAASAHEEAKMKRTRAIDDRVGGEKKPALCGDLSLLGNVLSGNGRAWADVEVSSCPLMAKLARSVCL